MQTNYIALAVKNVGRNAVRDATGVDLRAIIRWEERGKLPRTDYTGETSYAQAIADIPGVGVSFAQLLPMPKPLLKQFCKECQ